MALQEARLEEEKNKLMVNNESLHLAKHEMIDVPKSRFRLNRCAIATTKKITQTIPERYLGLALKTESNFSEWYLKEGAKL